MSRVLISEAVAVLIAAYPSAHVRDQTAAVYENALIDLPWAHVDAAVRRLILTEQKFMPSVATVRALAIELRDGRGRSGTEAWGDVRRAVGRYGRNRLPVFDDPLVAHAVDALGWREICNAPEHDPSTRARFAQLYDRLATESKSDSAAAGILPPPRVTPMLEAGADAEPIAATMRRLKAAYAIDEDEEPPPWED